MLQLINDDKTVQLSIHKAKNENYRPGFDLTKSKQGDNPKSYVSDREELICSKAFSNTKSGKIPLTFPVFQRHKVWVNFNIVSPFLQDLLSSSKESDLSSRVESKK